MSFEILSPEELLHLLSENAANIEYLGNKKIEARTALTRAEIQISEKESSIYTTFKNELPATKLALQIKHAAATQREAVITARRAAQQFEDQLMILIEKNNNLKAYLRLRKEEIINNKSHT